MYRISSIFGLQHYKYCYCSSLSQLYFLINHLPLTAIYSVIRSCILSNNIKSRVLKDFMACNNDAIECYTYEIL